MTLDSLAWAKRFFDDNGDELTLKRLVAWADENPRVMDVTCGRCGLLLPYDVERCRHCGHVLKKANGDSEVLQ